MPLKFSSNDFFLCFSGEKIQFEKVGISELMWEQKEHVM